MRAELPDADLQVATDAATAESYWPDVEVVFTWNRFFGPEQFKLAPRLQWLHSLSAGVDRLLFPELKLSGVVLTSSRGVHATAMAHHAMALILALARRLDFFLRAQTAERWVGNLERPAVHDLAGKTLAVVGLGAVGRKIAELARAFEMKVVASRRRPEARDRELADEIYGPDDLHVMLGRADVVSVTCPLTRETASLFDANAFSSMKRGAWFVNIARGGVVEETALVHALSTGQLAAAALDVFAVEPLPPAHPLWSMEGVIITPHMSVASEAAQMRAIALAAENFRRFRSRESLIGVVQKDLGY